MNYSLLRGRLQRCRQWLTACWEGRQQSMDREKKKERRQWKQASRCLITLNSCDLSTVKDAERGLVESEGKAKKVGRRCRRAEIYKKQFWKNSKWIEVAPDSKSNFQNKRRWLGNPHFVPFHVLSWCNQKLGYILMGISCDTPTQSGARLWDGKKTMHVEQCGMYLCSVSLEFVTL